MYIVHLHLTYIWSISGNLKTKWLVWGSIFFGVSVVLPLLLLLLQLHKKQKKRRVVSNIQDSSSNSTTRLIYLQYFDSAARRASKKLCLRKRKWRGACVSGAKLTAQSASCCDMTRRWLADDGRQKNSHWVERRRERGAFFFCFFFLKPRMLPPK